MRYKLSILIVVFISMVFGCTKYWDEQYNSGPETVDENIWKAIQEDPDLSIFASIVKQFNYDTLFLNYDNTYTLFIPDNIALSSFLDTENFVKSILDFHISEQYIQPNFITGKRKILTKSKKFTLLENYGNLTMVEGIKIDFISPLYKNGRYFKMNGVAIPKPNIYEQIVKNNFILKTFIDSQDSIVVNIDKSQPVGFDEFGQVIYDTVPEVINKFEDEYFPIKHEFRNKTATLVFPKPEVYNEALSLMAENLGENVDFNDISDYWQNQVIIPLLLNNGIFEHSLEEYEFEKRNGENFVLLKNILGENIIVDYAPDGKILCSNGYIYSYSDFVIPESFYAKTSLIEAETLLRYEDMEYSWDKNTANHSGDISVKPFKRKDLWASNDSVMKITFPRSVDSFGNKVKYTGNFSLNIESEPLYPRRYLMVVRLFYEIGGVYDVYVNDELVKTIDYDEYYINHGNYYTNEGVRIRNIGKYNIFDCYVESMVEYGRARIRFEYKGPGEFVPNEGLAIDYIELIPADLFEGYQNYVFRR